MQFPDIDDDDTWLSALAQFKGFCWTGNPPNRSPKSALLDFSGLRIKITSPIYSTALRLRSDNPYYMYSRSYECPSLYDALSSIPGMSDVDLNYYCDDLHEIRHDPGHVVLALVVEWRSFRDKSDSNEAYGIGLRPGPQTGTWKRHGFWRYEVMRTHEGHDVGKMVSHSDKGLVQDVNRIPEEKEQTAKRHDGDCAEPSIASKDSETECISRDIISSGDKDEEKDRICIEDSLFLHLPGVKLEIVTLV